MASAPAGILQRLLLRATTLSAFTACRFGERAISQVRVRFALVQEPPEATAAGDIE